MVPQSNDHVKVDSKVVGRMLARMEQDKQLVRFTVHVPGIRNGGAIRPQEVRLGDERRDRPAEAAARAPKRDRRGPTGRLGVQPP